MKITDYTPPFRSHQLKTTILGSLYTSIEDINGKMFCHIAGHCKEICDMVTVALNTLVELEAIGEPLTLPKEDDDFFLKELASKEADFKKELDAAYEAGRLSVSLSGNKKPDEQSYWKERCLLAEDFIERSPCDPDITHLQCQAYNKWMDFKKPDESPSSVPEKKSRCCGRCDGVNDICVCDMICEVHHCPGCDICWPKY